MRILTLAAAAALILAGPASAQPVVVIPKPGDGCWTVSYTRMFEKGDPPTGTAMSGMFRKLSSARAEAARLQRWSQSMTDGSEWKLKKIYIEGEDAEGPPPKSAAPQAPSLFDAVAKKLEHDRAVNDSLRDLGVGRTETGKLAAELLKDPAGALTKDLVGKGLSKAVSVAEGEAKKKLEKEAADLLAQPNAKLTEVKSKFKDYLKNVEDAYKRARDAKTELMGLTKDQAEKRFKEVNALVDRYNKSAAATPPGLAPVGSLLPRLTPVGPGTVKKAEEWRDALKQQFALERKKSALDSLKAVLDSERSRLEREWKALPEDRRSDPYDPKVISLRKQLSEYREKTDLYGRKLEAYQADVSRLASSPLARRDGPARPPAVVTPPRPASTVEGIAGSWGYMIEGRFRESFRIERDGTAIATAYFANSGRGRATVNGNRVEIVVNGTWGTPAGKPYLRWDLTIEGDKLNGRGYYRDTSYGELRGWLDNGRGPYIRRPEGK
jgi:hypothetical protein